jgi:hypothetical protein
MNIARESELLLREFIEKKSYAAPRSGIEGEQGIVSRVRSPWILSRWRLFTRNDILWTSLRGRFIVRIQEVPARLLWQRAYSKDRWADRSHGSPGAIAKGRKSESDTMKIGNKTASRPVMGNQSHRPKEAESLKSTLLSYATALLTHNDWKPDSDRETKLRRYTSNLHQQKQQKHHWVETWEL